MSIAGIFFPATSCFSSSRSDARIVVFIYDFRVESENREVFFLCSSPHCCSSRSRVNCEWHCQSNILSTRSRVWIRSSCARNNSLENVFFSFSPFLLSCYDFVSPVLFMLSVSLALCNRSKCMLVTRTGNMSRHSSFFWPKICIISKNCAKGHAIHRWKALFFYM